RKFFAHDTIIGDISTSQAISLVAFPVSSGLLLWTLKRKNPYEGLPLSPAAPPEQVARYGPGEWQTSGAPPSAASSAPAGDAASGSGQGSEQPTAADASSTTGKPE